MPTRAPTSSESVIARLPLRAPGSPPRRAPTALDDSLPLPPLATSADPLPPRAGDARITFRAPTVAASPAARRLDDPTLPRPRLASGTGAPPSAAASPRVPRPLPKPPPTLRIAVAAVCALAVALVWALSS